MVPLMDLERPCAMHGSTLQRGIIKPPQVSAGSAPQWPNFVSCWWSWWCVWDDPHRFWEELNGAYIAGFVCNFWDKNTSPTSPTSPISTPRHHTPPYSTILHHTPLVPPLLAVHPIAAQEAGAPGAKGWLRENSHAALRLKPDVSRRVSCPVMDSAETEVSSGLQGGWHHHGWHWPTNTNFTWLIN